MPWCTDELAQVQNHPNSKHSCTKTFKAWCTNALSSVGFANGQDGQCTMEEPVSYTHLMPWCTDNLGHVQNPPTVSYTHRDVYKRQPHTNTMTGLVHKRFEFGGFCKWPRWSVHHGRACLLYTSYAVAWCTNALSSVGFANGQDGQCTMEEPVSYTHLMPWCTDNLGHVQNPPTVSYTHRDVYKRQPHTNTMTGLVHKRFEFGGFCKWPRWSVHHGRACLLYTSYAVAWCTNALSSVGFANGQDGQCTMEEPVSYTHLMPWCTDNLGHVQNPPTVSYTHRDVYKRQPHTNTMTGLVHKRFEFGGFCKWPRWSVHHGRACLLYTSYAVAWCTNALSSVGFANGQDGQCTMEEPVSYTHLMPWCTDNLGHVQNPPTVSYTHRDVYKRQPHTNTMTGLVHKRFEFGGFCKWPRWSVHHGRACLLYTSYAVAWCTNALSSVGFANGQDGQCTMEEPVSYTHLMPWCTDNLGHVQNPPTVSYTHRDVYKRQPHTNTMTGLVHKRFEFGGFCKWPRWSVHHGRACLLYTSYAVAWCTNALSSVGFANGQDGQCTMEEPVSYTHLMPWCTDNLGHVQNPPTVSYTHRDVYKRQPHTNTMTGLVHKRFEFGGFCKWPRWSVHHGRACLLYTSYAVAWCTNALSSVGFANGQDGQCTMEEPVSYTHLMPWCTDNLGHVQNPPTVSYTHRDVYKRQPHTNTMTGLVHKRFEFGGFCKWPRWSVHHGRACLLYTSYAVAWCTNALSSVGFANGQDGQCTMEEPVSYTHLMPWCTDNLGHVQNPPTVSYTHRDVYKRQPHTNTMTGLVHKRFEFGGFCKWPRWSVHHGRACLLYTSYAVAWCTNALSSVGFANGQDGQCTMEEPVSYTHLMPWCTDNLGHVQNPPTVSYTHRDVYKRQPHTNTMTGLVHKRFEFGGFCKWPRWSVHHGRACLLYTSYAVAWCTNALSSVGFANGQDGQCTMEEPVSYTHLPSHLAIPLCTANDDHATPALTTLTPHIAILHKAPHQAISVCRGAPPTLAIKLPTKPSSYGVVHRPTRPCAKPTELKTFVHQDFHGIHLGTFGGLSNPHYSFGDISRPFQPSHLKNHEIHFFTKLPTKPSSNAVVHRPPWPCAKPSEIKTFVHQDFHGIHLGTFLGLSNPHISKTTNFIFSQNSPQAIKLCRGAPTTLAMCKTLRPQNFRAPRLSWYSFGDISRPFQPSHFKNHEFHFFTNLPTSHQAMPWCTDNLGHVQNPPTSKLSCTKTFMVFIWGHFSAFPTLTFQKPRISFFHKPPHKPSSYAVVHRQPWPCAKPSDLKTFVHQDFHGIHLGTFLGLSNPHISKTTNFIFSQTSPQAIKLCRGAPTTLAMCKTLRPQNFRAPRLSWYSFGDISRPFQPSHFKNHEFHFFTNLPTSHQAMPWCTDNLGHVQNPPTSKLSCTKTFMVFIWGHFSAFPTLTFQKPRISFFHKPPHKPSSYAVVHRQPWPCAKPSDLKTFVHQDFHGIHLGTFLGLSNPHISKTTNFIFSQTSPQAIKLCRGAPTTLAMCKTLRPQNFRAPRLSWYSFGDISRPFQPSHFKNHEFHFFTNLPTSHQAMPWCTDNLGHVQNPPTSKLSCTKTFMVFIWGHFSAFPTLTFQKPRISFFHKPPHKPSSYAVVHRQPWPCAKPSDLKTFVHQDFHGIHLGTFLGLSNPHISKTTNFIFSQTSPQAIKLCRGAPTTLAMCKTLRPQNFRAPRLSWYSFGDISRPFQPSHFKNHEFHFFTNLPTSHQAMPWCTDNLGHVQNPPTSKLSCTKTFMVFIWGHF
ncbi:hypothetical protein DEO72_LG1g3203 [Vigna unguiculata]|uniref:Uncharacterized protein n=1 Tax=Vigna unguiculata TaxID=3917 RepID=A0A4D6KY47_VIGUN|nr:hypothetical protein DEO72_LG1g3203 [Vigna unguiculata]